MSEDRVKGDQTKAKPGMHVRSIVVRNFRLLRDVEISLSDRSTVIVGRNNSGKTSLTELFRRLLVEERTPVFQLEDFSLSCHEMFWKALDAARTDKEPSEIREALPCIEAQITIAYDHELAELGPLGEFVIDLDPNTTEAIVVVKYGLDEGRVANFFEGLIPEAGQSEEEQRVVFYKRLRERVPRDFRAALYAVDPTDETNTKRMEDWSKLRALIQSGFISAQRGLDDRTSRERDVLGGVLESLFRTATSERATSDEKRTAEALEAAVESMQMAIDSEFAKHLAELLPTLELFGYPGLTGPALRTETSLRVESLLSNHTRIRYEGANGVNLPETYNGLGMRNLIFILFQLLEFFKEFQTRAVFPGLQLVFIEEPEAHLHPQMQEVFIRQLSAIVGVFAKAYQESIPWPVQFIVSTHSSHIANEAPFDATRYFMAQPVDSKRSSSCATVVKDLSTGMAGIPKQNRDFLHKYLTLTRCDLFFADKAILIEGATERLLLPRMIEKVDAAGKNMGEPKLASQYLSVVEVGGAYAHIFFDLLDFLELRTLVITDIDAVGSDEKVCDVSCGAWSSNACINKCFGDERLSLVDLLSKSAEDKTFTIKRLAYQVPETSGGPCGRSFEDAFILANQELFGVSGSDQQKEEAARRLAQSQKKTDFAIEYAIEKPEWNVPLYISEGLEWLAKFPASGVTEVPLDGEEEAATSAVSSAI